MKWGFQKNENTTTGTGINWKKLLKYLKIKDNIRVENSVENVNNSL